MRFRLVGVLASALLIGACAARARPRVRPAVAVASPSTTFVATAYCRGRLTASGAEVRAGVIAADPSVLPIGTVVRITGLAAYDGTYTVLDTGPGIRGRRIDLYMANCSAARRFGRKPATLTIIPSRVPSNFNAASRSRHGHAGRRGERRLSGEISAYFVEHVR